MLKVTIGMPCFIVTPAGTVIEIEPEAESTPAPPTPAYMSPEPKKDAPEPLQSDDKKPHLAPVPDPETDDEKIATIAAAAEVDDTRYCHPGNWRLGLQVDFKFNLRAIEGRHDHELSSSW